MTLQTSLSDHVLTLLERDDDPDLLAVAQALVDIKNVFDAMAGAVTSITFVATTLNRSGDRTDMFLANRLFESLIEILDAIPNDDGTFR